VALTLVTYLAQASQIKALAMAALGIFLGTIGEDPFTGVSRFVGSSGFSVGHFRHL